MARGGWWTGGLGASQWLKFGLSIMQLGLTVTIIVLVRYQLNGMSTAVVNGKLTWSSTCYLAVAEDWPDACTYADVVSCVSLVLTFILSVLQFCSISKGSGRKHCPRYLLMSQRVVLLLAVTWWGVAASILQHYGSRADSAGLGHSTQRAIVIAFSWGSMGLFAVLLVIELLRRVPQQQSRPPFSTGAVSVIPMQSYPVHYLAPPPAAAGAPVQAQGTAAAPAGSAHIHRASTAPATGQQIYPLQPQQQQPSQVQQNGVVVGIPCAPAAPVAPPPLYAPQQRYIHHVAPAVAGLGAGAYQSVLMSGGVYGSGGRVLPVQHQQIIPAWAAGVSLPLPGSPGRVVVINPDA